MGLQLTVLCHTYLRNLLMNNPSQVYCIVVCDLLCVTQIEKAKLQLREEVESVLIQVFNSLCLCTVSGKH